MTCSKPNLCQVCSSSSGSHLSNWRHRALTPTPHRVLLARSKSDPNPSRHLLLSDPPSLGPSKPSAVSPACILAARSVHTQQLEQSWQNLSESHSLFLGPLYLPGKNSIEHKALHHRAAGTSDHFPELISPQPQQRPVHRLQSPPWSLRFDQGPPCPNHSPDLVTKSSPVGAVVPGSTAEAAGSF